MNFLRTKEASSRCRNRHCNDDSWIGGDQLRIERHNINGELVSRSTSGTAHNVDDSPVAAAREYFDQDGWSDLHPPGRALFRSTAARAIKQASEEITLIHTGEAGKPRPCTI